jgi:hypothetical protein
MVIGTSVDKINLDDMLSLIYKLIYVQLRRKILLRIDFYDRPETPSSRRPREIRKSCKDHNVKERV